MIEAYPFQEPTSEEPNLPFPDEIRNRPWVLYHGTCSAFEEAIEAEGILPRTSPFTLDELTAVDSLFRLINWCGLSGASLAVLRPFSIEHDFAHSSGKPVYFAECSSRACLYATHDHAGGEVARALRHCFEELQEFADNVELRTNHLAQQRRGRDIPESGDQATQEPSSIDVEDFRRRLGALSGLRRRAERLKELHSHGLVYAVEFSEADIPSLLRHPSMGIKAFEPIPVSRLIAKTIVPSNWTYGWPPSVDFSLLPSWNGILSHLRKE